MSKVRFGATVATGSERLVLDDHGGFRALLRHLSGKRVHVTVEPIGSTRSNQANRRYWGRIVRGVRNYLNVDRMVPLNKDQVHYVLAKAFLGQEDTPLGPAPMETHVLTVQEFTAYMDKIEAHFAAEGVEFPDPDDGGEEYE